MTSDPLRPAGRYHHGDLRHALLVAARALLEEGGPAALNLREIARRVGVSAPSAYHHFSGLEALTATLAEQGFAEWAAALDAASASGGMSAVGEAYVAFAVANPGLYRLMFGEGFHALSEASAAVRALRSRAKAGLRAALAVRVPEAEVETAVLFLWSLTHGLSLLLIDRQARADDDVRAVLRLAARGLPLAP